MNSIEKKGNGVELVVVLQLQTRVKQHLRFTLQVLSSWYGLRMACCA